MKTRARRAVLFFAAFTPFAVISAPAGAESIEVTDAQSHLITTRSQYDAQANVVPTVDPSGNVTQYPYDSNPHPQSTDPSGNPPSSRYASQANVTATIDPNGHTTQYQYDDRGTDRKT